MALDTHHLEKRVLLTRKRNGSAAYPGRPCDKDLTIMEDSLGAQRVILSMNDPALKTLTARSCRGFFPEEVTLERFPQGVSLVKGGFTVLGVFKGVVGRDFPCANVIRFGENFPVKELGFSNGALKGGPFN